MSSAVRTAPAAACPVCRGQTHTEYRDLYDDRYGYPDTFDVSKCEVCGHLHTQVRFTPEDLMQLYTRYYPRGNFVLDTFKPEDERHGFFAWLGGAKAAAFRWVPRNVRVLDIGCGIGATLAYHRDRGCEAIGIEADENVQPIAQRFGLDICKGVFDGTQFTPASFDYVTLDQVAEHVTDPLAFMQGVARILKPGGTIILTTPNPVRPGRASLWPQMDQLAYPVSSAILYASLFGHRCQTGRSLHCQMRNADGSAMAAFPVASCNDIPPARAKHRLSGCMARCL